MRYREVGLLAEGGMALVHKAVCDDGTVVVVKRVRPPFCFDASYLRLFADEGAVHAALDHPNIVRLLERGEDEAGPYLVFEHVDGVDLAHALEHLQKCACKLEVPAALALFVPLFRALQAAHEAIGQDGGSLALVHRDVSPGNVLIATDGGVKLADFGVAASTLRQEATVAGEMKGKFAYMAPEQTRGERVGARADLFSAGIVMWEALAGGRLFDGPTDADVVHAVRERAAPPLAGVRSDLPAELGALCARLLEKDPERRPASARAVADALEQVALSQGLDEGLARHAARLVRDVPQRDVVIRDVDVRRRTQRVLGETAATGVLVVRQAQPAWRRPAVIAAAGGAFLLLGAAITVGSMGLGERALPPAVVVTKLPDPPVPLPPAPAEPPPALAPIAVAPPAVVKPAPSKAPAAEGPLKAPSKGPVKVAVKGPASGAPEVAAASGLGFLSIATEPWAEVWVDGKLVDKETPLFRLALPAGPHVVRLVNPIYKLEKTVNLTVQADGDLRRYFDLNQP